MKILNLYAGIGGNRKLWGDNHDITAVEFNPEIAEIYKSYFPNDKVIVADAHQFLLDNYKDYEFIWSSPPCPSHSDIRRCGVHSGQYSAVYPEMELYQEIILLKYFVKGFYAIENVIPYYKPLINPQIELGRHYFWSNINLTKKKFNNHIQHNNIVGSDTIYGFNISKRSNINKSVDKRKILRNLVNPELGKHIMDCLEVDIYNKEINLFSKT